VTTTSSILIVSLVLVLLGASRAAEAQPPERSVRVGLLAPGSRNEDVDGFLVLVWKRAHAPARGLFPEVSE
jgi:hypothetical protein